MRIGIICASDTELEPFLPIIADCETETCAMLKFYCGKIGAKEVIALYSGVCKVNAAVAAQILIDRFAVDIIINSGTAGAMDEKLKIFDTVIVTEVAYHDVSSEILTEFHPFMPSVWFKSDEMLVNVARNVAENFKGDYKIYFGQAVTGESFINRSGRKRINKKFNPLIVDMETGSIAHVCFVNKVPFIVVRSVTDTPDESGIEHFEENCLRASENAKDITLKIIEKI